ncbi:hypothetical protein AUJ84_03280 [Candidatus Pacearchaeota archaeon CG1_02_32_132]|nr:MAG: hypothetical protein AUJ84_03280 [Candidatus Pacearchaeota archaeon CG1_02_32_132]
MSEKRRSFVICNVALSEIFILILAVFAFAFIVGEAGRVSAGPEQEIDYSAVDLVGSDLGEGNPAATNNPTDTTKAGGDIIPKLFGGSFFLREKSTEVGGVVTEGEIILGGVPAHLITGALWGGIAGGVTYMIAGLLGASDEQAKAASLAVGLGVGIARFGFLQAQAAAAGNKVLFGDLFTKLGFGTTQVAFLWGIGIAAVAFIILYKKTEIQKVTLECLPWEAPLGGKSCEECNSDSLQPCSEYRCKALGQACDIVNKGTTDEKCVWVNPNDVKSPQITPWDKPLTEGHRYSNHDTLPSSQGAKIVRNPNNCIQAFTPLQFGIVTDEPAQCKIDIVPNKGSTQDVFDNMQYYFGDSLYGYNHTETLNLPSPESVKNTLNGTEAPEVPIDGIYNFYTRCRDANGNFNVQEFVFQLCVDDAPDTTPPVIVETSINSGSYVSYGIDEVGIDVYVNEPADCRWDIESKNYDDMVNTMECSSEIYEMNARQLYPCSGTLKGIEDKKDNKFYFRCRDKPTAPGNERNTNVQSYEFVLKGSQPLNIIKTGPNETIFGSTTSVKVDLTAETSNGAEEGKATCYFSNSGAQGSYIAMFETFDYKHKQKLQLPEGDYTYYLRCVDVGGNSADESVEFRVETDNEAPMVTRAYRTDGLKIVTNEDAECVYSLNSCNYVFEEGLKMIYSNPSIKTNHFAEWQPNIVYYIKCRDFYGNAPLPDQCSMIASASNVK